MRIYVHGVPVDIQGGEVVKAGDGLSKDGDTLELTNPTRGIYTLAQWDALTPEERLDGTYIVDDKYSGSPDLNVYSTEERRVGTWIDGKPVYQKVFTGTLPAASDTIVSGARISNIDRLILLNTIAYLNDGQYNMPYVSGSGLANMTVRQSGDLMIICTHSGFFSKKFTCIAEYTKTTDLEVSE